MTGTQARPEQPASPGWKADDLYTLWVAGQLVARESPLLAGADPRWTERHLQCVWYDSRLRPDRLATVDGEAVEVTQPGRWNLEAGPDFLDAELCVGTSRRIVRGDVEVHVRPADWDRHRHGGDPRYAGVVLHVTYHVGPEKDTRLPAHILRVALQEGLAAKRRFAFEDIDVGAYPHAVIPATPRPCGMALEGIPQDCRSALLASAGRHRLRAKAARLAGRLRVVGDRHQVFYEEVMAVLGYKRNSAAFRRVAERLPLAAWTEDESIEERYARLLGTAGLLPDPEALKTDAARTFARELWDAWFRYGGGADSVADEVGWNVGGMRPANHPVRRLAAAAALFARPHAVLDALTALPLGDADAWTPAALRILTSLDPPAYWAARQSLDSAPGERPLALLGTGRAAALLTNAVVPLLLAENPAAEALGDALPPEDLGSPARETAFRLFGRDHNPVFYQRSGLRQQGLLAVYQDFCLTSREGCLACPLSERLREAANDARSAQQ